MRKMQRKWLYCILNHPVSGGSWTVSRPHCYFTSRKNHCQRIFGRIEEAVPTCQDRVCGKAAHTRRNLSGNHQQKGGKLIMETIVHWCTGRLLWPVSIHAHFCIVCIMEPCAYFSGIQWPVYRRYLCSCTFNGISFLSQPAGLAGSSRNSRPLYPGSDMGCSYCRAQSKVSWRCRRFILSTGLPALY